MTDFSKMNLSELRDELHIEKQKLEYARINITNIRQHIRRLVNWNESMKNKTK